MLVRKRDLLSIGIIIIVNLAIFLPAIYIFPYFNNDDFIIFSIIQNSPYDLISTNPHEIFFLFLRPTAYFTFWVDFGIFGTHSSLMKIHSIVYLIVFQISFLLFLKEVFKFFNKKYKEIYILFTTLIIAIHPIFLNSVLFIYNRNEILVILFYTISLLMVLYYLKFNKDIFLLFYLLFYILSILSKQQSLHLPLLVMFVMLISKGYISKAQKNKIITFSIIGLMIMIMFIVLNIMLYSSEVDKSLFLENWWKKPFAILGSIVITIFPILGKNIYEFFILNKSFAFIILFVLLILLFLFRKSLKIKLGTVVKIIIFVVIVFFPRMLLEGTQERINSIVAFWTFFMISFFIISLSLKARYKYSIYLLLISIIVVNSLWVFNFNQEARKFGDIELSKLDNLIKNNKDNYFLLVGYRSLVIPFEYYFYKNEKFGSYKDKFKLSNVVYDFNFTTKLEYLDIINNEHILVNVIGDSLIVKALSENISLNLALPLNYYVEELKLLESRLSKIRGYDYLALEINVNQVMKERKLIYYNGVEWIQLN